MTDKRTAHQCRGNMNEEAGLSTCRQFPDPVQLQVSFFSKKEKILQPARKKKLFKYRWLILASKLIVAYTLKWFSQPRNTKYKYGVTIISIYSHCGCSGTLPKVPRRFPFSLLNYVLRQDHDHTIPLFLETNFINNDKALANMLHLFSVRKRLIFTHTIQDRLRLESSMLKVLD